MFLNLFREFCHFTIHLYIMHHLNMSLYLDLPSSLEQNFQHMFYLTILEPRNHVFHPIPNALDIVCHINSCEIRTHVSNDLSTDPCTFHHRQILVFPSHEPYRIANHHHMKNLPSSGTLLCHASYCLSTVPYTCLHFRINSLAYPKLLSNH